MTAASQWYWNLSPRSATVGWAVPEIPALDDTAWFTLVVNIVPSQLESFPEHSRWCCRHCLSVSKWVRHFYWKKDKWQKGCPDPWSIKPHATLSTCSINKPLRLPPDLTSHTSVLVHYSPATPSDLLQLNYQYTRLSHTTGLYDLTFRHGSSSISYFD